MANYIFGDATDIVCQHTLGEFRFSPKANESFTIDMGGIRTNDDNTQVTGNGQPMFQMNRKLGSIEGPIAVDMISNNELHNLEVLTRHPEMGTWTISFLNGTVFKTKGRPVGDLQADSNAGTMTLKIAGGKLEKIN